jgi:ABC-2 type transport system ATP-binding protein
MIEVRNLIKTFGPVKAVDDISFDIERGEIVGFLGPNGAGKTTTMRILTCFLTATSGSAKIAGHDVAAESIEVRKKIGYLPENAPLYLDMRVDDYLKFIARARGIPSKEYKNRLDRVMGACGVSRVMKMNIAELSKGYKQRVGLAQAMIHDPEILILDEPTSGLDPIQIIEIRKLIQEIGKERTVVLSTHILQEVSAVASRIILVNNGRLIADGPLDKLEHDITDSRKVVLTIEGPHSEINNALNNISGIRKIDVLDADADREIARYEATTSPDAFIDQEVMKLCIEKGWKLMTVQHPKASLEDVFISLVERDNEKRKMTAA